MPVFPLVTSVVGGLVNSPFTEDGQSNIELLRSLFNGVDGFAIDFTNASKLYQDSGATTPVTTDGDLVGYAQDDSGNGNHFTQATAANKPEWVDGEGIQAIDSGDLLGYTLGATLSDFTLVLRLADVGNAAVTAIAFQSFINANNQVQFRKATTTVTGYTIQGGATSNVNIKTSYDSSGTVYTAAFRYNDSTGEVWGQFEDETAVTNSRTPPETWGTTLRIAGNTSNNIYTLPIHRMILFASPMTDAQVETVKTLVEEGW